MPNLFHANETIVGGASVHAPGPLSSNDAPAANSSRLTVPIPAFPPDESNFVRGFRSVWVYYPQGLVRRPMLWSDIFPKPGSGPVPVPAYVRQEVNSVKETRELSPFAYSGHSLYQESFFFCKIKNVGDAPGAENIYVEIVVDGYSLMAFAKIYSERNAMNAADLLRTHVLPYFQRHGVTVERVFTRKDAAYCGLAPMHPFETILATSNIQHLQMGPSSETTESLCKQFFDVLKRDFFMLELRKRFQQSLELLQQDLDVFVKAYNSQRTGQSADPQIFATARVSVAPSKR